LRGMPAAFLVTAIQQVVAFCALGLGCLARDDTMGS